MQLRILEDILVVVPEDNPFEDKIVIDIIPSLPTLTKTNTQIPQKTINRVDPILQRIGLHSFNTIEIKPP